MASARSGSEAAPEVIDFLVIGAGIAGCSAALTAADAGARVTLLTCASDPMASNTRWAQGGIIFRGVGDSPELLIKDTFEAGCGIGHRPAIERLARLGPQMVQDFLMDRVGVVFDRSHRAVDLTEEGAHSIPRIVHVADKTGLAIQTRLVEEAQKHRNIRFLKNQTAVDLLTYSHHSLAPEDLYALPTCFGAYVLDQKSGRVHALRARETLLATGGLGYIYQYTTNPPGARGDGIAMSYRAGARMLNLEYVQFHPTALYHKDANGFLISESMRGEGGELVNARGETFMKKYHRRGSLAPRDVVTRAIHDVMLTDNESCVYLDITHKPAAWVRKRFPQIWAKCKSVGIDCAREPIPVVPAAHYACGGVWVDLFGRTTIDRLWAAGEVACTGVHGANRLASTSLLEGLVWGRTVGEQVTARMATDADYRMPEVAEWQHESSIVDPALIRQDWATIKNTMWNYVGVARSYRNMRRARRILRELQLEFDDFYRRAELTDEMVGLRNGLQTALAVLYGAMENRHSCGAHFRIDEGQGLPNTGPRRR